MPIPEGAIILGALAAFFFCMMCVAGALKYYFGKKAEEDAASETITSTITRGPSASAPGPAAASDVLSERDKLIQGTSDKVGGKKVLDDETDINVAAPPSLPSPFTINSGDDSKAVDYTISFDIKVEKNLPRDAIFTILARGGTGEGANDQRPHIYLKSTAEEEEYCTLRGIALRDCYENKAIRYINAKNNRIILSHKPSAGVTTDVGPQAGADYKNCTIVVTAAGDNLSTVRIYWDAAAVGEGESAGADWGTLDSEWKWAWGQTAVNNDIGYVKIKNAYIFKRALDADEIAVLQRRGATASTYVTEPAQASWKFNPTGYESD